MCTTHPDRDADPDLGTVGDILSENAVDKIINTINDPNGSGHPEATQVSYRHDWLKQDNPDLDPAGVNSTVEKRQTEDGHWGAFVDTEHTTTFPDKDKLIYDIDKKIISGYSIEYDITDFDIVERNGEKYKFIKDLDFYGYAFANGRKIANPKAEITAFGYKEMIQSFKEKSPDTKKKQEENKMEIKEEVEKKAAEEKAATEKAAEEKKVAEEKAVAEKKTAEEKEVKDKEMKEFNDFKAKKAEADKKIKVELKEIADKKKPLIPSKTKIENKEAIDTMNVSYKEAVFGKEGKKADISVQWKEAGKLHTALARKGMIKPTTFDGYDNTGHTPIIVKSKEVKIKNGFGDVLTRQTTEIQYKSIDQGSMVVDANYSGAQTTYWDALDHYEQTPAEMNDIYSPVIISQLNEMHTTWNLLPKDDLSGASAIRIRVKTARPTADGSVGYGSTPTFDSRTTRLKLNSAFVTNRQDVAVEFEEIELARSPGGIGDIYALEVQDATEAMMYRMNSDLLIDSTTASESEPHTFKNTIKTTGSLYGKTVDATTLAAAGVDDMDSKPLTLEKMRAMIDGVKANGALEGDLVFISHYTQSRKFKTLIQQIQRTVPTSARVGFTGRAELDGVPLYEDHQAATGDLFLISLPHNRIGVKKAASYVEFGLVDMQRKGVVWMMSNYYCTAPNRNYWIHTLKTT